jgi:hypothetical protein
VTVELFSQEQIPWDQLAFESTKDALRDYYAVKNRNHLQKN